MSYVLKNSLVAGSISALALLSSVNAAYAGGISSFDETGFNAEYGEILVEWDIDGIDTSDELIAAATTPSTTYYYSDYTTQGSNPSEKPAMVATETGEFDFTDSPSDDLASLATASTW